MIKCKCSYRNKFVSHLTCTTEECTADSDTPLKSETFTPLMATTGLSVGSNVSAVVPHRVRPTSAKLWSTSTRSRLVNSFWVRLLVMVVASLALLQMPKDQILLLIRIPRRIFFQQNYSHQ